MVPSAGVCFYKEASAEAEFFPRVQSRVYPLSREHVERKQTSLPLKNR